MLTSDFLKRLQSFLPAERLFTDPVDCYAYAYDNTRKIYPPEAVVFPLNTQEVQEIIKLCNEFKVPVTPRGRGTGAAGGSLPERGGVLISLERMRRIIKVDTANRIAVVEPGVLNQEVQEAVQPRFFWPPDPSSSAYCSIGGNLATCAGGPHAIKYGVTRDHVLGLRAVTGKGDIIKAGSYTTKSVVGYDLTRLIIGSEGTLAVITEATLKLSPRPEATGGLTAHYRDNVSCAAAISALMGQPTIPSALEFLDQGALNLLRGRKLYEVPEGSVAMLMIEVDGAETEIQAHCNALLHVLKNPGLLQAQIAPDTARLWAARKALSPLLRDVAAKKINEDIAVPVSRLPELLQGLETLVKRYQIANVNFGHAGNGNIHVNLLLDPEDKNQVARAEQCLVEVFNLVLQLNGSLSGEHGVGSEKRAFVGREIDAATLALMKEIKRAFDPNSILNPGKIFS